MHKARDIVVNELFAKTMAKYEPDARRHDDAFRGMEWALARAPDKLGRKLSNRVWMLPLLDIYRDQLDAYYTFTDDKVYLLAVRARDKPSSECDPAAK